MEVTRSDSESLVLISGSADRARTALLELAAQLVAVSTSTTGTLIRRLIGRLRRMLALSTADQQTCANDVLSAARGSSTCGTPRCFLIESCFCLKLLIAVRVSSAFACGCVALWFETPHPRGPDMKKVPKVSLCGGGVLNVNGSTRIKMSDRNGKPDPIVLLVAPDARCGVLHPRTGLFSVTSSCVEYQAANRVNQSGSQSSLSTTRTSTRAAKLRTSTRVRESRSTNCAANAPS
ncbi:hypothetical protein ABIB48_000396 [Arthrobacter sp. UYCu511]